MKARAKKQEVQDPVEGKWDLPAGWEWKRLGEVATTSSGGTPSRKSPEFFQGTIPWVKSGELNDSIVNEVEESITQQALNNSSAKIFPKGTLCIALYGATVGKLGCLGINAATNQAVCAIFSQKFYGRFLFYYLLLQRQTLVDLSQGGAQPNISQTILGEFPIPIPPTIQDQERIVDRIDSLFAELDKAEEALRHTITLCEQYKQSLLKAAVTGELSKEWRKANPPTETGEQLLQRILKERRAAWEKAELAKMTAKGQKPANDSWKKKYKEPHAPDTSGLPELPEGWTWASLDQLTSIITSGSRGWADYYAESGAIFIRAQDIKTDSLVLDNIAYVALPENSEGMRTRVSANDILITITGANVTKTALVQGKLDEAYVSQHVALSRPVLLELASYLYLWVTCPTHGRKHLESLAYGAGKPGLSLENIKTLVVALPPIEEQEKICTMSDNTVNSCETTFSCEQSLQRCTALRQSILKQAFTGQLT